MKIAFTKGTKLEVTTMTYTTTTTPRRLLAVALLSLSWISSASSFCVRPAATVSPKSTVVMPMAGDEAEFSDKVKKLFDGAPKSTQYDVAIKLTFPGALSYEQLENRVVKVLGAKGYTPENTLLATSLCADELARNLEKDFVKVFGKNFNLGGLSGFPFAGNTGFGAMSAHIPDDGYCLIIYAPHVGVATSGGVGKVERPGIELVDNCCGSAIAAYNYLKGIVFGGAELTTKIQEFTDFQQGAVQELILPHGKRLKEAEEPMVELPYALYESQDILLREIVKKGASGTKKGLALLGGIQINTAPEALDYFLPLRFDYMNNKGEVLEDMLDQITYI